MNLKPRELAVLKELLIEIRQKVPDLWDPNLTRDYTHKIDLNIYEMRVLVDLAKRAGIEAPGSFLKYNAYGDLID